MNLLWKDFRKKYIIQYVSDYSANRHRILQIGSYKRMVVEFMDSHKMIKDEKRLVKNGTPGCCCRALFLTFLRIGAFTFGGGYAMIPLIQKEVVEDMCWMNDQECVDIIGVTQVAPGAVAINTAIYIGYKLLGVRGAIAAAAGIVLPSFLIILIIAMVFSRLQEAPLVQAFFKGVRPGIVAMIGYAAFRMSHHVLRSRFSWVVGVSAFVFIVLLQIHPIAAIIVGGFVGAFYGLYFSDNGAENGE
jgi:chromate transporter